MSETKIFSMPSEGSGSGMWPVIASLCNQRGLDPNMVMAMMNRNGYGDGFGGSAWWIIILLIFGWGGFGGFGGGFGGRGSAQGLADLGNLVNNDAGRELLMQAIQGNATAISQLATTVHCDVNTLQSAIANVSQSICQLGNTVGLGQQQIINAIQAGNASLASQLASCCCENRLAICQQTNTLQNSINTVNTSVERGFASTAYETAQQTCDLKNAIAAQTTLINDKFCQLEMREMVRENQNLRDQVQAYRLSDSQRAQTAEIINTVRPCPTPAFLTCNPWASTGGFYGNGYGNYPYGYNNGCGCNNGNSGCSCGCGY